MHKRILLLILTIALTFPAMADGIVDDLGIFHFDDLQWVLRLSGMRTDDTQLMRMPLPPAYDASTDTWLTASGIVSDLHTDLDGDGQEECLLVYVNSTPQVEQNGLYWENEWHLAVCEGETIATDQVIPLGGTGDRRVLLTDDGILIYTSAQNALGETITWQTHYAYDEEKLTASATIREISKEAPLGEIVLWISETETDGITTVQIMMKTTMEPGLPLPEEPEEEEENPTDSVDES